MILEELKKIFEKRNSIVGFIYDEVKDFQPSGDGWDMGTNKLNILCRSVKLLHNETKPYYYSKVGFNCFWTNYQDKYGAHQLSDGTWVNGPYGGGTISGHYPVHNFDNNYGQEIEDLIFCMMPVDDICTPVRNYKRNDDYEWDYDEYDYDEDLSEVIK